MHEKKNNNAMRWSRNKDKIKFNPKWKPQTKDKPQSQGRIIDSISATKNTPPKRKTEVQTRNKSEKESRSTKWKNSKDNKKPSYPRLISEE
jgi:hypothetical protein